MSENRVSLEILCKGLRKYPHKVTFMTAYMHEAANRLEEMTSEIQELETIAKFYHKEAERVAKSAKTKRGKWLTSEHFTIGSVKTYQHVCNDCKYTYNHTNHLGYKYCPECGLKMKGTRK